MLKALNWDHLPLNWLLFRATSRIMRGMSLPLCLFVPCFTSPFFLFLFFFFFPLRYNISWGSGKLKLRFTLEEELILPMSVRIFLLLFFFFPPALFMAHFPPPVIAGIQESLGLDHPKFRNPSHPPAADLEP